MKYRSPCWPALSLAVTLSVLLGLPAFGATTSASWVSQPTRPSVSGNGHSFTPTLTPDGRFVVFVSQAKDLTTNRWYSPYLDVYVRDLTASNTVLVSVSTNGLEGGSGDSILPSISADGRFVTFESAASNLAPNDTNGVTDIFLRDLVAGTTTLLSVSTTGQQSGNRASRSPSLSPDGQWVVFESAASDLVTNDLNGNAPDVFVRRVGSAVPDGTLLATVNAQGTGSALSRSLSQTSDSSGVAQGGSAVVFFSLCTNLLAEPMPGQEGIFFRDLVAGTNLLVSAGAGAFLGDATSFVVSQPTFSQNGHYIAYHAAAVSMFISPVALLRYDLQTGVTAAADTNVLYSSFPQMSADGRFVVVATSNAVRLADMDMGQQETVGDSNSVPGITVWANPALSADGTHVALLGAPSADGPWSLYLYERGSGSPTLAAFGTNGHAAEVSPSCIPSISAEGRRIAFESAAGEIVAADRNQAADIFVSDTTAHTTELVSAHAPSRSAITPVRHVALAPGSVSEFGGFVAFTSLGGQLTEGEDNPWQNAYVRDVVAEKTEWLHAPEARALLGPIRVARTPVLSANGRHVAWFEQHLPLEDAGGSTNIIFWEDRATGRSVSVPLIWGIPFDTPGPALTRDGRWLAFSDGRPGPLNVFIRDMSIPLATNQLISVNHSGTGGGDADCILPKWSADGRWIVFLSRSITLTTNQPIYSSMEVFARDLASNQTYRVSRYLSGDFGSHDCTNHVVSGDSRFVVFQSKYVGFLPYLFRHDLLASRPNDVVCQNCKNPSVSADGRLIAYESNPLPPAPRDVYLADLETGQTTLLSSNVSGSASLGGSQDSFAPQVSADGRYVVFASRAQNLVLDDTNNLTDVFVYDRFQHATLLLSRSPGNGGLAYGYSSAPVLARDGRTVAFVSSAPDLLPGELSGAVQVYLLRLGGADSDADGLDDDWEMAYFSTLDRDGTGDFDGDGATDLAEFRAGTDPTNAGSVLRVLNVTSLPGGAKTVLWAAEPGRRYRVQFKRRVTEVVWSELGDPVTATSTTGAKQDPDAVADPGRFYRVLLDN
jgi:Tol biopolymer transport system component